MPKKNLKEDQIDKKAKTKEKVCLQFLFSFRTMSKQLTILGKISGQIEPYFGNPQITYEQYVKKNWQLNHGKYGLKQDFLSAVLMEWEHIKNDKKAVADYIEQDAPPPKQIRSGFIHHIPSTTSSAKGKQSNPLLVSTCSISSNSVPCQSPALNIPNVFVELLERESYLKFNEYQLVIQTLSEIGTKNLDNVLTDDVVEDQSLMQTLASFAHSWNAFNSLRLTYDLSSKKNRKLLLKDNLRSIDLLCNELANLIKKCSDCKKSPSMNVSMLSQTFMKRLEVVKEIIAKVGQINAKASDHSLLSTPFFS